MLVASKVNMQICSILKDKFKFCVEFFSADLQKCRNGISVIDCEEDFSLSIRIHS